MKGLQTLAGALLLTGGAALALLAEQAGAPLPRLLPAPEVTWTVNPELPTLLPGGRSVPVEVTLSTEEPTELELVMGDGSPLPVGIQYRVEPLPAENGRRYLLQLQLAASFAIHPQPSLQLQLQAHNESGTTTKSLTCKVEALKPIGRTAKDAVSFLNVTRGEFRDLPVETSARRYLTGLDARSGVYLSVDEAGSHANADGSFHLRMEAVNTGLSDATAEVYDSTGKLVGIQVISFDPIAENLLESLAGIFGSYDKGEFILGASPQSFIALWKVVANRDARYFNQDFPNRKRTKLNLDIPAGGSLRIGKSSPYALSWNVIKAAFQTMAFVKEAKGMDESEYEGRFLQELMKNTTGPMAMLDQLFKDDTSIQALMQGQLQPDQAAKTVQYFLDRLFQLDFKNYLLDSHFGWLFEFLNHGLYNLEKMYAKGSVWLFLIGRAGAASNVAGQWLELYVHYELHQRNYLDADVFASVRQTVPEYITVPAQQGWVGSGIHVRSGDTLRLLAEGKWANGAYINDKGETFTPWYGPEGANPMFPETTYPLTGDDVKVGTLIGRIGPQGQPFRVGESKDLIAETNGEIFFSINDDLSTLADNQGEVKVRVIPQ